MALHPSLDGPGRPYATADEVAFLKRLGRHRPRSRWAGSHQHTLLRQYRAAMGGRQRWGQIDPRAVRAYLDTVLNDKEGTYAP